ncbi:MAG: hypothetical protein QS748_01955 [Candidatus Endonucleobacter bathymodioli]|uniref:Uncharacterized protein n=1 Tax=Candidatus Endonucleibacter bathymodioli TaxID=539814 RepID=A0AA90NPF3_9GAMM|nr:hypothetical protein [Candidatus Endonucleobacter bathymodioli]
MSEVVDPKTETKVTIKSRISADDKLKDIIEESKLMKCISIECNKKGDEWYEYKAVPREVQYTMRRICLVRMPEILALLRQNW